MEIRVHPRTSATLVRLSTLVSAVPISPAIVPQRLECFAQTGRRCSFASD